MKMLTFAGRNAKEIIRDPLTLIFGLGFPLVLILLLSAIQANIPVPLFEIEHLTPGITVFGLSFMSLFSATLISKDRNSSLLQRLYTTPLTPVDFILGYTLPIIPFAVAQSIVCYIVAIFLGLEIKVNILLAILFIIPMSILFIALGLLFGSILNDKQVGGVCGALLTNLSAWLSGTWFDLDLVGGGDNGLKLDHIADLRIHGNSLVQHLLVALFAQVHTGVLNKQISTGGKIRRILKSNNLLFHSCSPGKLMMFD